MVNVNADRTHDGLMTGELMVDAWQKKCLSIEEAFSQIEKMMEGNHDEYIPCEQINLINDNGRLQLSLKGMNDYDFTRGSLSQLAGPNYLGLGCRLFDIGQDDYEKERIQELYIHRWDMFKKGNENKQQFLRLRNDGTVRAFLSGQYKPINHLWLAERLFDSAGEDDMVRLNLSEGGDNMKLDLIDSESMQALVDSGGGYGNQGGIGVRDDVFGKMISSSNSEVGNGRLSISPSIYRCICANGCIMSMEGIDSDISVVHKGRKDLDILAESIVERLLVMSKYVAKGLADFSHLMDNNYICTEGVTEEQVVCQIGKDQGLTKNDRFDLFRSLMDEPSIIRTGAYACINAVTKYAQLDNPNDATVIELAAGKYLNDWQHLDTWHLLNKRASQLNVQAEIGLAV